MSSWILITLADLQEARVAALVSALATAALAVGQPDPTPGTIAKVTEELRMAIAFSGRYVLDAAPASLPASLKDLATQKVIRLMKTRLLMELTEDERRDESTYQERLKALIAGKWPVEKPDTAGESPAQSSSTVQVVSSSRRRATDSTLNGL